MIATRVITKEDLERAAEINDAIALEFNKTSDATKHIGGQLGIDIVGAAIMGRDHAKRRLQGGEVVRSDAVSAVAHAFAMGVVIGLRAVEVVGRE